MAKLLERTRAVAGAIWWLTSIVAIASAQDATRLSTEDEATTRTARTHARTAREGLPTPDAASREDEDLARVTAASGREAEIERARRVAPFDLTWGDW